MVCVKPEHIGQFIEATVHNHEASVLEKGNLRFDVLQDSDDPGKFLLYEAYESADFAAAHKKTPHYLKWKETVAPWMLKPREAFSYKAIRPLGGDR
jgi:autoinducer 2-degrading protein